MHGCEQICVNNEGSFECECSRGFTLDSDEESCSRKSIRTCDSPMSVLRGKNSPPTYMYNPSSGFSGFRGRSMRASSQYIIQYKYH